MKGPYDMRRKHSEITETQEIHRILSSARIGRLATNGKDGYPYITPVNFVHLKQNIYFHCSLEGEKLGNIARDPRVCFEVDVPLAYLGMDFDRKRPVCHIHQFYQCVIIRGIAADVQDDSLKIQALNALIRKHEGSTEFEPVEKDMPGYKSCKVVEIRPVSTTAKANLAQKKTQDERRSIAEYLGKRNHPGDRETVEAMAVVFESTNID
jgi:nitroimidazol reductase NimA-like FMN-containing flavoprotein (pyridoxamine 5'-phosphate oxidase superfamily)